MKISRDMNVLIVILVDTVSHFTTENLLEICTACQIQTFWFSLGPKQSTISPSGFKKLHNGALNV